MAEQGVWRHVERERHCQGPGVIVPISCEDTRHIEEEIIYVCMHWQLYVYTHPFLCKKACYDLCVNAIVSVCSFSHRNTSAFVSVCASVMVCSYSLKVALSSVELNEKNGDM